MSENKKNIDLSQGHLIEKMNRYLELNHRDIRMEESGECGAFALMELYFTAIGKRNWYLHLLSEVSLAEDDSMNSFRASFEKLIAHIEWIQRAYKYISEYNDSQLEKRMDFLRNEGLPQMYKAFTFSFVFDLDTLTNTLEKVVFENKQINLVFQVPYEGRLFFHSVGIMKNQGKYYWMDPSDDKRTQPFNTLKEIVDRMNVLYQLNEVIPASINVYDLQENMPEKYPNPIELKKQLISKVKDVNFNVNNHATPLFMAVANGDEKLVKSLLTNQAVNVDFVNSDGISILTLAVVRGNKRIVENLIDKGAYFKRGEDIEGVNLHEIALISGNSDMIKLFFEGRVNVPLANTNESPLIAAVNKGTIESVKAILSLKPNLLEKDDYGKDALHYAIKRMKREKNNDRTIVNLLKTSYKQLSIKKKIYSHKIAMSGNNIQQSSKEKVATIKKHKPVRKARLLAKSMEKSVFSEKPVKVSNKLDILRETLGDASWAKYVKTYTFPVFGTFGGRVVTIKGKPTRVPTGVAQMYDILKGKSNLTASQKDKLFEDIRQKIVCKRLKQSHSGRNKAYTEKLYQLINKDNVTAEDLDAFKESLIKDNDSLTHNANTKRIGR
ncbi:MAG: ankyrin repeat domain-containing protein [Gammaproteobacteria bacterium]